MSEPKLNWVDSFPFEKMTPRFVSPLKRCQKLVDVWPILTIFSRIDRYTLSAVSHSPESCGGRPARSIDCCERAGIYRPFSSFTMNN